MLFSTFHIVFLYLSYGVYLISVSLAPCLAHCRIPPFSPPRKEEEFLLDLF